MKSAAVLCVCWWSTVHSIISLDEKYHKCLPRGPVRSTSVRGALCCFLPRYMRFLWNIQKQGRVRLEMDQFLAEKKYEPKLWNVVNEGSQIIFWAWTLKWRFLKGHVDPSYVRVLNCTFLTRQGSETLLSETRGGAHSTRMVASEYFVEFVRYAHCSGVCTLHPLSIEDGTRLGIRPMVWVPGYRPNRRMDIVPRRSHHSPRSYICIILYDCGRVYSKTTCCCLQPKKIAPPLL